MKAISKTTFIGLCLLGSALTASAQLKVANGGTVYIKGDSIYGRTCANIGQRQADMTDLDYVYYYTGLRSFAYNTAPTGHVIGVFGEAKCSNLFHSYGCSGIWGVGGGGYTGRNMGVTATLHTGAGGAGLYATNQDNALFLIGGNWSGYFYGPVHVVGQVQSTVGFYNISDMRLKRDVVTVADKERETGSTLDNLSRLAVLEYGLRTPLQDSIAALPDSLKPTGKDPNPDIRYYGVSAQELQKLYPDLVMEGEDGYLSVNYSGLVPLLLRSIQELKTELDNLKGKDTLDSEGADPVQARDDMAAARASQGDVSAIEGTTSKTNAVLYQNSPNPFTARTEIRFSLPDDAPQAYIYIFDMTGKMQKQIPVSPNQQSVTINGYELSAGIYLYSLVVGGQEIDTKRMILSK